MLNWRENKWIQKKQNLPVKFIRREQSLLVELLSDEGTVEFFIRKGSLQSKVHCETEFCDYLITDKILTIRQIKILSVVKITYRSLIDEVASFLLCHGPLLPAKSIFFCQLKIQIGSQTSFIIDRV